MELHERNERFMVVGALLWIWPSPVRMGFVIMRVDEKDDIVGADARKGTVERFDLVTPGGAVLVKSGGGEYSISMKGANNVGMLQFGKNAYEQLTERVPPAIFCESTVSTGAMASSQISQLYWPAEFISAWKLVMGGQYIGNAFNTQDEHYL
jgi:hypothetical protein